MDMRRKAMRIWYVGLVLALVAVVLAGCGAEEATPATADEGSGVVYTSEALDTSYDGALDASTQLVLGTMRLEGTENAVTPGQAAALLPLWQALRGGVTAQAELAAVLKQIEGTMTSEQLEAIAAMQLTQEDLRAWMEEQDVGPGGGFPGAGGGQEVSPELRATRQAEFGSGEVPPEMATRRAEFGSMSEEEREALRATAQAGGGFPGGSEGGAGGGFPGGTGGRTGRGAGQFGILLNPLIELLTQRAAE
jgi:hypothetical protein